MNPILSNTENYLDKTQDTRRIIEGFKELKNSKLSEDKCQQFLLTKTDCQTLEITEKVHYIQLKNLL